MQNGHKAACKKTQARVAAAMASAQPSAAGSAPTQRNRGAAKRASVCTICLDAGDQPPIQSGCACRGDAGLAHVGCRVEAAEHSSRDIRYGWQVCMTCGHGFTGHMAMGLAEAWWSAVKGFDAKNEDRQCAGNFLVQVLAQQGRYVECEEQCRELRAVQRRMSGPDSTTTMNTAHLLGNALYSQNKYAEAEVVHREVLAKRREQLGGEHRDTLGTLISLGNVFSAQGKLDDARAEYQDVLTIQQRVQGAEHVNTMCTKMNIAGTLSGQSKYQEAEVMLRELLEVQQRVLGAEHPDTLNTRYSLCSALYNQDKYGEAEARCREVLAAQRRVFGVEHPNTQRSSRLLAGIPNHT